MFHIVPFSEYNELRLSVATKTELKQVASMKRSGIEDNWSYIQPLFRFAASRLLALILLLFYPAKLVTNVNVAGLPRDAGYTVFAFADVSVNGALVCAYSN